jgi:hypothetical protein
VAAPSLYSRWLFGNNPAQILREADGGPPESLLQLIWLHQRLRRNSLATLDGAKLEVLHPGFRNREAGPDFRGAVLRFAGGKPVSGDVEVDRVAGGWKAHGHGDNPSFAKVILHVTWEDGRPAKAGLPSLAMRRFLDAPVEELAEWARAVASIWPEDLRGKCCAPLRGLSPGHLNGLLKQAAQVRLERKGREFEMRARATGWEQTLREGLFRGLGYKKNSWPMQRLAELLPGFELPPASPLVWQARLLGLGGLLPEALPGQSPPAREYLQKVWDHWWREREIFAGAELPRQIWSFHGQRPVNHPQRRLALAAHWLASGNLPGELEGLFTENSPEKSPAELARYLASKLQGKPDPFWSWHWTLRSASLAKSQPLLGVDRSSDLAMNAVLPWLWARATASRRRDEAERIEKVYMSWPKGADNAVLKLARQRLLGNGSDRAFTTAATQQGLLQIVGDFCAQAGSLCAECRFPELARQAAEPQAPGS